MKNTFIRLGILGLFSLLCGAFSTARTTYEGEDNHPDSNNLVVSNRVILEDKVGHDTICPVKFDSIVVQRCASDTTFKIDGKVVGYGIHYRSAQVFPKTPHKPTTTNGGAGGGFLTAAYYFVGL